MRDDYYDPRTVAGEWTGLEYDPYRAPAIDPQTRALADLALSVLTPIERDTIELAYGFRGDARSDQEVAQVTGETRGAVKKRRQRALAKMREALADDDAEPARGPVYGQSVD